MNQIIDIDFFVNRNKVRNYLHFDKKIDDKKLFVYVTNPDKVAQHSFLPTISYLLNEKKLLEKSKKNFFVKKYYEKDNIIMPIYLNLEKIELDLI